MTMMMMITSIGKARQNNHFCREQRHAQNFLRQERARQRRGEFCRYWEGYVTLVSLEVKEMVWGKRRLLDSCLCSVSLKMEGEERRGKEREGKERRGKEVSRYVYQVYNLLKVLHLPRYYCTYHIINQSTHLSIYLSVCLLYMYKECLLAYLLAGCCC